MNKQVLAIAASVLIALPLLAGDESREERVQAHPGRAERGLGLVRIPVEIDLTGVKVGDLPATLGGYVARVTFDASAMTFIRAIGGTAQEFRADPAFTSALKANADGTFKVAAAQTSVYGPTGKVVVATLVFREMFPGAADGVRIEVESAAAPLLVDGSAGTQSLPVEHPKAQQE